MAVLAQYGAVRRIADAYVEFAQLRYSVNKISVYLVNTESRMLKKEWKHVRSYDARGGGNPHQPRTRARIIQKKNRPQHYRFNHFRKL